MQIGNRNLFMDYLKQLKFEVLVGKIENEIQKLNFPQDHL